MKRIKDLIFLKGMWLLHEIIIERVQNILYEYTFGL